MACAMTSIAARVAFTGQKVSAKNTRAVAKPRATVVVRAEDTKVWCPAVSIPWDKAQVVESLARTHTAGTLQAVPLISN